MTIVLNRRVLAIAAVVVVIIAGLAVAAKSYADGQDRDRRDTATRVLNDKKIAAEKAAKDKTAAVKLAVTAQKRTDKAKLHATVKRMNKQAKRKAEAAYKEGQSDGYSSGQSAGYSSGSAAGREQGIEDASDELICSDDNDVDLPSCDIFW